MCCIGNSYGAAVVGARGEAVKKIRTNFLDGALVRHVCSVNLGESEDNTYGTYGPKSLPGLVLNILERSCSDVIFAKLSSKADARGILTPFNMICGQSEPQMH